MTRFIRHFQVLLAALLGGLWFGSPVSAQEVIILSGTDRTIEWLKQENWWGEANRGEQLQVPHVLITAITERWKKNAPNLPVPEKKEIFYRFLAPLVLHANAMVMDRRQRLQALDKQLSSGNELAIKDRDWLLGASILLGIRPEDEAKKIASAEEMREIIAECLYRLDIIPAGLVLGQAAYESGYGTSRFAVEGNALFGQWTFGGEGIVPEQQRTNLGDHRIAAYDWPFDSVRSYYINLSSHPAYEDFRRLRAELRSSGKKLTSLALADGLIKYSERGQEYVDTLKGIIRVNKLDIADGAVLRDEPVRFLVGADSPEEVVELEKELANLRKSGELKKIIARMQLE